MRFFIGVPLPDSVKQRLVQAQEVFKNIGRMTLVKQDVMHVSILFLGEVEPQPLVDKLKNISFKPFKATLKGLSFFPNKRFVRVVHSPVSQGLTDFQELYLKIVDSLGVKPSKFVPHATLARVKFVKDSSDLISVCSEEFFELSFDVNHFVLYSSELTPKGPVYSIIKEF